MNSYMYMFTNNGSDLVVLIHLALVLALALPNINLKMIENKLFFNECNI